MAHAFEQSTGKWFDPLGNLWGIGWAGQLGGRNNPDAQKIKAFGPLPVGWYTISPSYTHPHLGTLTFDLTPDPLDDEYDRSLFRIHGFGADNVAKASEGCIIQIHTVRIRIDSSPDRRLQVVRGPWPTNGPVTLPGSLVT